MAEARRRAVFEAESRVLTSKRRLAELEESMRKEGERMKDAAQELENLERVRSVCYVSFQKLAIFLSLNSLLSNHIFPSLCGMHYAVCVVNASRK